LAAERVEGGGEEYLEGEGKRGIVAGMRGWTVLEREEGVLR
jgi:hypothetical protein